jgi:hypothetical protein
MAFGLDLNIKETPQMQRQMQRINSLPPYHRRLRETAQNQLFAQAAQRQFDRAMMSARFKMERDSNANALKLATRRADLAERKLDLRSEELKFNNSLRLKEFGIRKEGFRDRVRAERLGSYLGLGTFGVGLLMDAEERRRQDDYNFAIKDYISRYSRPVGSTENEFHIPGE